MTQPTQRTAQCDDTDDDRVSSTMTLDAENGEWGSLLWIDGVTRNASLLVFQPDTDVFTVGRHPSCHFVTSDERVSSIHFRVLRRHPPVLEDCSSNGTACNSRKLTKGLLAPLHHGDEITLVKPNKRSRDATGGIYSYRFIFRAPGGSMRSQTVLHSIKEKPPVTAWQRGKLIGHGATADVYLAITLTTGEMIAVKHLRPHIPADMVLDEVNLLRQLRHRNIVSYLSVEYDADDSVAPLRVLMEYVSGGSLASVVNTFGRLHENVVRIYATEVLLGLEYLHTMGVVHGDIKAANLLLSDVGTVKLADFGTSVKVFERQPTGTNPSREMLRGTPAWMSPDMIRNGRVSFASDVWAFGCLMLELLTGKMPWSEMKFESATATLYHIAMSNTQPAINLPPESSLCVRHFVSACLALDPHARPDVTTLLQHEFITSTRCEAPMGELLLRRLSSTKSCEQQRNNNNNNSHNYPTLQRQGAMSETCMTDISCISSSVFDTRTGLTSELAAMHV